MWVTTTQIVRAAAVAGPQPAGRSAQRPRGRDRARRPAPRADRRRGVRAAPRDPRLARRGGARRLNRSARHAPPVTSGTNPRFGPPRGADSAHGSHGRTDPGERGRRACPSGEHLALRFYDVTSADGTRIKAWTNDAEGPTLLLCNGLGTNPYAWPARYRKDCGVRVVSWNHRGSAVPTAPRTAAGSGSTRSSRTRSPCSTTRASGPVRWSVGRSA